MLDRIWSPRSTKVMMKTFDLSELIDSVNLKRQMVEGKRLYAVEDAHYPSVTTVLSNQKKKKAIIRNWRKKVGAAEADRITKRSTTRGTNFHAICEDYLLNKLDLEKHKDSPLPVQMFRTSQNVIDRIDRPRLIESMLWSHKLQIAGQVDCIAELDGDLSVIDFKTSKSPKRQDILDGYFTQMCAYGYMFYERYNIEVKQFAVIVACEDGECQLVKTTDKEPYYIKLTEAIKEYEMTYATAT